MRLMAANGPQSRKGQSTWHAVEVRCSERSCAAAKALRGQRFLSGKLPPRLPLAACDHPETCQCKYGHFDDRRGDPRRDYDPSASGITRTLDTNKRMGRGRREDD